MVWGAVGETQYASIASVLSSGSEADPTLVAGLALILAGLGFKIAAVPFHMWAPDVYEGAPTPVTAYLAIGSKAAAFALVLRLFGQGLLPVFEDWRIVLAVMAAGTMVLGNLGAIVQRNIKRLLAYASIGQVGYLLLGVAALAYLKDGVPTPSLLASNGVMLHLVGYAIANLAVFTVVGTVYSQLGTDEPAAYAGLAKRSPYLALVMASALFSLAGLPFFVGFVTKFYLFTAAAQSGLLWLAGLAIASSVVSLYYYLVIVRRMYVEDSEDLDMVPFAISIPRVSWVLLGILLLGTILLGIYPGPLLDGINAASAALLA
jgi:NADH-quinone oxidoreductase subunit N